MREETAGGTAQLEHAAVFYAAEDEYLDEVLGFVGAGLDDGGLVFVAVPGPKLGMLREHLDLRASQVTFADMTQLGANPAWIIPRVRAFFDANPGRQVRYVGEPIWETRSAEELCEATRHEALINLAFAGVPVRILCPYDITRLDPDVIANAEHTHPVVIRDGHPRRSPACTEAGMFPEQCDQPLPAPPRRAAAFTYRDGLAQVRAFAGEYARKAGLSSRRVADLVTAVHELAANTLRHTSSDGLLNMWASPGEVVCQVQDAGCVSDPLVGRCLPAPDASHGHGLWVVHQLCDLVELRTGASGTTIRLHMRLSP